MFEHFGALLFFDYYESLSKRDGSYESTLVFSELSQAQLACRLDGCELGDRQIEVQMVLTLARFGDGNFQCPQVAPCESRTLLVRGSIDETLTGIFRQVELTEKPSTERRSFHLVEFESVGAAGEALSKLEAVEAKRVLELPQVSAPKSPVEEVMIYGVPASKLLEPRVHSSATVKRSRSRSRSRSRERSRERERYGDRERHSDRYSDRYGRDRHRDEYRYRSRDDYEYRSSRDRDFRRR